MNFVHLHAHSSYSILDAWGRPDQIVPRIVEAGLEAHALTDHDSVRTLPEGLPDQVAHRDLGAPIHSRVAGLHLGHIWKVEQDLS